MTRVNRRQFMKGTAAIAAGLSLPGFLRPRLANAACDSGPKKLVVFFLNGGNDAQNTIVPYKTFDNDGAIEVDDAIITELDDGVESPVTQHDFYRMLRPKIFLKKDASVMSGGSAPAPYLLPLQGNVNITGGKHQAVYPGNADLVPPIPSGKCEFAIHPSATGLQSIWDDGNLAIFPAAHCGENASRSHFYQTEYYGHGLYTTHSNQYGDSKGWVGRYFDQKYSPDPTRIEGFDFESSYFPLFDGINPVIGSSNPGSVDLGDDGLNIRNKVLEINALRNKASGTPYGDYAAIQQALFDKIAILDGVNFDLACNGGSCDSSSNPYWTPNPDNPDAVAQNDGSETSTARRFRQAAALIKDAVVGPQIEVINIDRGSFDTHGSQVQNPDESGNPPLNSGLGSHARTWKDVSDSIKAFYDDLNDEGCGDDVITLVQTEFGRTADENDNYGTDHGGAACWFAVGNKVNGGLYGDWPGTAFNPVDFRNGASDLNGTSRKWLAETVDYRDIFSEILKEHLGDGSATAQMVAENCFNPGSSVDYSYPGAPLGFVDTT